MVVMKHAQACRPQLVVQMQLIIRKPSIAGQTVEPSLLPGLFPLDRLPPSAKASAQAGLALFQANLVAHSNPSSRSPRVSS